MFVFMLKNDKKNTKTKLYTTGKNCEIPKLEKHWKIIASSIGKPILEKEIQFPTLESHFIVFQGW